MRAVEYAVRQAAASLWRNRGSSLFAMVAIALAIAVLGAVAVVAWNAERWLSARMAGAELSVYLRDGATAEERGGVEGVLDQSGVIEGRRYVSKGEALTRFRAAFRDLSSVADEFDANPFPASIEARLRAGADVQSKMEGLVRRVGALPGVADVRYDREWLERLGQGLSALRLSGAALGVLLALAAGVTVATVVRLGLYTRRAELEIMELVGAPLSFIRGPFVAEGLLQGGVGAMLALVLLRVGYAATLGWWGASLEAVLEGTPVQFLPWSYVTALVLGGMFVGALGGLAASRHAGV